MPLKSEDGRAEVVMHRDVRGPDGDVVARTDKLAGIAIDGVFFVRFF